MKMIESDNDGSNDRPEADAGFALCLQFERHWRGASETERSAA